MFCGLCPIICALRTQAAAQGPLSFICFHCSLIIICICGYRNLCCPFDLNSNHQHPCGSRASLSVRMADMQCNVLQYEAALTSRCTEWHPWHLHCLCTHIYRNTWSKYFLRFWKIIHTTQEYYRTYMVQKQKKIVVYGKSVANQFCLQPVQASGCWWSIWSTLVVIYPEPDQWWSSWTTSKVIWSVFNSLFPLFSLSPFSLPSSPILSPVAFHCSNVKRLPARYTLQPPLLLLECKLQFRSLLNATD